MSHQPLVQVLLSFEPQPRRSGGWEIMHPDVHTQTSKFDLCLEVDERAERLRGRLFYNSDLFERQTIRRMIGHLRMALEGMVAQPGQPSGNWSCWESRRLSSCWGLERSGRGAG